MSSNKWLMSAALYIAALAPALAETPQCPESIGVKDVVLEGLPAEWKSAPLGPKLYLMSEGVTDGPIQQMAELKPASTRKTKSSSVSTWTFAGSYPDGLWLLCGYGPGGGVKIGRPLPSGLKECALKTANDKMTMECK